MESYKQSFLFAKLSKKAQTFKQMFTKQQLSTTKSLINLTSIF